MRHRPGHAKAAQCVPEASPTATSHRAGVCAKTHSDFCAAHTHTHHSIPQHTSGRRTGATSDTQFNEYHNITCRCFHSWRRYTWRRHEQSPQAAKAAMCAHVCCAVLCNVVVCLCVPDSAEYGIALLLHGIAKVAT